LSALRNLLASLWAALWLHARLLGIRVRRLFGRAPGGDATGAGYHLTVAETPVEGVDYDPIDLPPELQTRLAATRADLLAHAPGATAGRAPHRRRRTATLVAAFLLTLGVVGTGASALVTGSTGVPAVDRALGIYEAELAKPEASGRPGPSGSDLQPGASGTSTSIDVPLGDGSSIVTGFYTARDGRICAAFANVEGSGTRPVVNCVPPQDLFKHLETDDVNLLTTRVLKDEVVVIGFVSSRVASLRGDGPSGALDIHLGSLWTPGPKPSGSLKPFVAVGPNADPPLTGREFPRSLDPNSYAFEAVAGDGSRIR
jgi:hypothetical protein